jgi:sulfite exporter TauE/SafE
MMSDIWLSVLAAFGLGLAGAGHCLGMCGGVVAALSFAVPADAREARWKLNAGYNLGRIASYSLMGGLVAALAGQLPTAGLPLARTLAGLLLIAMGLYLANWWRGLLWLERGGQWLWRRLKPLGDRFLPLDSPAKAVAVGLVWGWLPCGLVYATLGYALAQADVWRGALVMAAFGLGTLPALLVGGLLASRIKTLLAGRRMRVLFAVAYLVFGVWTLSGAWYHQVAHQRHPGQHQGHSQHHNPALDQHHH